MQFLQCQWKSFCFAKPLGQTKKNMTVPYTLRPAMRGENLGQLNCQVYMLGIYLASEEGIMNKAKVFKSGNSQAVRLPKEFRFDVKEVEILRRGEEIVLRKPRRNLAEAFDALAALPEDFMAEGRQDEPPQEREPL